MNPLLLVGLGVGGYLLATGKASAMVSNLGTDWGTAPIGELNAAFNGKMIGEIPPVAVQRLYDYAVGQLNAGPVKPGIYGQMLSIGPGQQPGNYYFFRWPPNERHRDFDWIADATKWSDPKTKLVLVNLRGQPHYGFFDQAAGAIKRSGILNLPGKVLSVAGKVL